MRFYHNKLHPQWKRQMCIYLIIWIAKTLHLLPLSLTVWLFSLSHDLNLVIVILIEVIKLLYHLKNPYISHLYHHWVHLVMLATLYWFVSVQHMDCGTLHVVKSFCCEGWRWCNWLEEAFGKQKFYSSGRYVYHGTNHYVLRLDVLGFFWTWELITLFLAFWRVTSLNCTPRCSQNKFQCVCCQPIVTNIPILALV